jgi:glycine/D-amino acid oxidase-like deaminating enzyme
LGDETIVPVRGQTVRLVPQPELTYGLSYSQQHVSMIPRRDGLIVSAGFPGDFNNASTEPDMAVSAGAITRLAALFPGT